MRTNKSSHVLFTLFILFFMVYLTFSNFLIVLSKFNNLDIMYFTFGVLKEVFFIFPFIAFLIFLKIKKTDIADLVILTILMIIGILFGIRNNTSIFNILISAKDYMIILFFLIFLRYKPAVLLSKYINLNYIYFAVISIFLINFIYTAWMYINFNGNLNILWFYKYYQNPVWNYIRDNHLRATGFFDTSIQNSIFFSFTTLIFYCTFIHYRKKILIALLFLLLIIFSILGIYMTHTRIGLILVVLGMLLHFIMKVKKNSYFLSIFLVSIAVIFTFLYIFFFTDELSARGRILQYINLFEQINNNHFLLLQGYGFGNVGPKTKNIAADSAVIETIYNFGLCGAMLYFYVYVKTFRKIFKFTLWEYCEHYTRKNSIQPFLEFSNLFFLLLIYISFFHSLVGKVVLYIFITLVGITIIKVYNCSEGRKIENSNSWNKRNTQ